MSWKLEPHTVGAESAEDKFHGTIPSSYAKDCNLRNLNLEGNQLPKLQVLVLRSNKFYGSIPKLRSLNDSFPKLSVFDLSNNYFEGHLPVSCMQNLKAMMNPDKSDTSANYLGTNNISINGHFYDYSITIAYKGLEIEMQKIFHIFTSIYFSNNMFEGEIPKELGNLHSLQALNLSQNKLVGSIPSSLANLTNIESLDLPLNKLVGRIPNQLADLIFLAILNVSVNQLAGLIPRGRQFDTFSNDSYLENLGLCGKPLSRKCEGEEPQTPIAPTFHQEDHSASSLFFESGFGWKAVVAGMGCGMVFGVSMGCIMFQTKQAELLMTLIEGKQRRKTRQDKNHKSYW